MSREGKVTGEGWGRVGAWRKRQEGVTWRDGVAAWREGIDLRGLSVAAVTPFIDWTNDDFNCLKTMLITATVVLTDVSNVPWK